MPSAPIVRAVKDDLLDGFVTGGGVGQHAGASRLSGLAFCARVGAMPSGPTYPAGKLLRRNNLPPNTAILLVVFRVGVGGLQLITGCQHR